MSSSKRSSSSQPDINLYEQLSEKERMIGGFPFRPWADDQLTKDRLTARKLLQKYNSLDVDAELDRQAILDDLLNSTSKGKTISIESPFRVDYGYNIEVGDHFYANYGCVILDCAPVTIGDNCLLGPNVQIYTVTHPLDAKYRQHDENCHALAYPITIGNNCWIGGQAIICPGVTIGNNVTVGAGSVVTKDVPNNVLVAGNPARVIREL